MKKTNSNRILTTPTTFAKKHYLFVQEIGTLTSLNAHVSTRKNIHSFLFFVVTNGSGTVSYKGKKHTLSAGDCILINCHELYAHESSDDNPWTLTWVHFYGESMPYFYHQYLEQGYSFLFRPASVNIFLDLLSNLYNAYTSQTIHTELLSNQFLTQLVTLCFTEQGNENKRIYTITEKLYAIRSYISNNLDADLSLDELSSLFFISKFHLSREYKKLFGATIGSHIIMERISKTKQLLRFTDDTIETIAFSSGFSDCGYFIKVFKKIEGVTPLDYRRKWNSF
ncbi:MAG: AraC family transcriptional regulator [Lachnospiraceae bacterium]